MAAAASSSSSSSNSSSAGTSSFSKPYIRHQEVGSGRHSKVYRAVEVGTKSILAVKVFDKPASFAEDIRRRHAIKNELKMLEAVRNGVSAAKQDLTDLDAIDDVPSPIS